MKGSFKNESHFIGALNLLLISSENSLVHQYITVFGTYIRVTEMFERTSQETRESCRQAS